MPNLHRTLKDVSGKPYIRNVFASPTKADGHLLAQRIGKPIEWDAENIAVPGHPEAEAMIRGTYREGWKIA